MTGQLQSQTTSIPKTGGSSQEQQQRLQQKQPHTVIVGISGCSSSGKTTLSRYLRDLFPDVFILHEDDFYRPEEQLPFKAGLRDWDCAASIDIPAFVSALEYIHAHGSPPPDLESKEDQNDVGPSHVPEETMKRLKNMVKKWTDSFRTDAPNMSSSSSSSSPREDGEREGERKQNLGPSQSPPRIALVDGFLLYGSSVRDTLLPHFDIKLLTRAPYSRAKARREARSGYVTLEGFWEDPPGYVDDVVWPNYVDDHAYLFAQGDVEGQVNKSTASELGVYVTPELDMQMGEMLEWAIEVITRTVR
ncbi:P-loop containing nucleoside triphosphate hydrolase protein [Xylona heveae TC161]|uniref:p-loop containing nucleoside triphosphate hydrolase protein n=1 Tax=Xylona heveae (strain CBS 132557 / TC161) TaxID=1328760 RepID=A0A165A412_XYLHT|nr:P-loop containing nucleoside triphosphate hydrolase protein [Xylona heveae TC161]KZF19922.1 P-loop containing nucleoside triphosphate hydrolase protein [Xylona heveae TC161]